MKVSLPRLLGRGGKGTYLGDLFGGCRSAIAHDGTLDKRCWCVQSDPAKRFPLQGRGRVVCV